MYERSDDWCLCVAGLWFHHKCHPSKVHASTKHNMGKHAYRAVYKSIQYTEYRVNTESCFLWYVRAVLESIFSTQYSKANSVQILPRTVSLGDSTERSVVPAAGCCFLPEGLTPKLHRKLALHIVCCVAPCKHSEAVISKPVHAPVCKPNHLHSIYQIYHWVCGANAVLNKQRPPQIQRGQSCSRESSEHA